MARKDVVVEPLSPVESLAAEAGLKDWETAGVLRLAGWASGKQVAKTEFEEALARFRSRPLGGGR